MRINSGNSYSFAFNGSSYTTLNDPLGSTTGAYGINGNNIVGMYISPADSDVHGFVYNGSTYKTLDDPLAVNGTYAFGIDGNNIVGAYEDSSNIFHSFSYNGSTYKTLDDPLAGNGFEQGTTAVGISGGDIVGHYVDLSDHDHGFLYDGSTYTTIDDPLGNTVLYGISGNDIVGSAGSHGFIATVPEPSTFALLSVAAVALSAGRRHRKRTEYNPIVGRVR